MVDNEICRSPTFIGAKNSEKVYNYDSSNSGKYTYLILLTFSSLSIGNFYLLNFESTSYIKLIDITKKHRYQGRILDRF